MLLDAPCAFVDLETTGTSARSEAITEIGVRLVHPDGSCVEFQQLVNPGRTIPGFITQLTGINNAMVDDQPFFEELAPALLELLEGAVLVAHNVRFDYSFLKAAFERCGFQYRPKMVCTVRLSRRLYPELKRHSLAALCQHIGHENPQAHRAMADVEAMVAFVEYARAEFGNEALDEAAREQFKRPSQPVHLPASVIDALPAVPGVYRFYGEGGELLYVGKSVDIASRVKSHFSADVNSEREMRLARAVRDIDYTETAGELGALLLENEQIKSLQPIFNRRQRRYQRLWCYQVKDLGDAGHQPVLTHHPFDGEGWSRPLYGLFTNRSQARKWLEQVVQQASLCKKMLGLEKSRSACFNYQLDRCRGACVGEEAAGQHLLRTVEALSAKRVDPWPFAGPVCITETRELPARSGELPALCSDYHLFDHWMHLGTCSAVEDLAALYQQRQVKGFDRETYRFLDRHIHLAVELDALLKQHAAHLAEEM